MIPFGYGEIQEKSFMVGFQKIYISINYVVLPNALFQEHLFQIEPIWNSSISCRFVSNQWDLPNRVDKKSLKIDSIREGNRAFQIDYFGYWDEVSLTSLINQIANLF